jgi:VWFA-related protein
MVRKYLVAQPSQLNSPAELMVLGNQSLEMVQGYTRNKVDLLYALDHLRSILPYKEMNGAFFAERFGQSIDALQQIALQNKGASGRKNIVWVGHGGPNIYTEQLPSSTVDQLNRYVHDTTNMLVDARVSLFVIYPGLKVGGPVFNLSRSSATTDIGDDDPFSGDINFGVFVNETGGKLFYNRNDINTEIKQSEELGSEYYTLTYQPTAGNADGKFRRIRVTLSDPNLRAMTKAGYFAPTKPLPSVSGSRGWSISPKLRARTYRSTPSESRSQISCAILIPTQRSLPSCWPRAMSTGSRPATGGAPPISCWQRPASAEAGTSSPPECRVSRPWQTIRTTRGWPKS